MAFERYTIRTFENNSYILDTLDHHLIIASRNDFQIALKLSSALNKNHRQCRGHRVEDVLKRYED